MIGIITNYVLRHRPIVLALLALFIIAGVSAFRRLPVEAYPDVTNVSFQIITLFPGHAAEEVERLVTIPIENEMNGIPHRTSIRSVSQFGLSQITLVFEDGTDNEFVRNQAAQHLAVVNLPTGTQATLSPDATPVGEIFRYTLEAPKSFPKVELKALEDWVVERQFRTVPGVVDVNGFGGPTKQYQVLVDPAKLKSYGLTLNQVFTALSNGNRNAGGSYIEHGPELYIVRGLGFIQNLDDIRSIAVDTRNGTPIRISDLATVQVGERLRLGRVGRASSHSDEDDAVEGIVILRRAENALEVLKRVRAKVDDINRHYLPADVRLVPYYDRTDLTERTLHTVRKNMIEGISLVMIVLILFLGVRNFRSALVVAAVVPLSLLGAFFLLDLKGIPANLISMGAIDFGIIVDSAVVVIENLLRLLEQKPERINSLRQTIVQAVSQMGRPILFSKAILLAAFIPLYTMQRVEGKIFRPMALTLTFALIVGTILALTIVPVLASFAFKKQVPQHESWIVKRLSAFYAPLLERASRARFLFLGVALIFLLVAGGVLTRIGSEFLPKLDEGSLWVRAFLPETISPSESDRITRHIRQILVAFPEVRSVVSQVGRPDDGTDINGFDVVENDVELNPKRSEWKTAPNRDGLCKAMSAKLAEIPGIEFQFSQNIEDNVNEAVSGVKSELSIKIYGEDPNKLQDVATQITTLLKKIPGAVDVGAEELLGQPQVQIVVDRAAIARYGLAVSDVQQVIETALGGSVTTQILEGERTFDLVVKLTPKSVSDLGSIRNIPVFGSNGERLTLGLLASIDIRQGFSQVWREENARRTAVKFSVRGRDLGSLVAEAQQKVAAQVKLPPGYRLEWTGAFENQQRAVRRLEVIVPITLTVIFFLLFVAFDSSRMAFLILMNVPFAAMGGIFALPLAGLNLSVSALVGFMALFGIAMLNGVILVERIRELRHRGLALSEAIREGALSRVRPVVMTALMAALGLLPMALSTAVGAETSRPFAVVIIGGLCTATLVTLLILPIVYPWFESEKDRTGEPAVEPI